MKKHNKSVLLMSVVTVVLLISAVTAGSTIIKKEAYVSVNEQSPVSSGFLDNFSLNGTILRGILNVLHTVNDTLNNATSIIEEVIIPIVVTIINVVESILDMPIFNPEIE
jgi:hypothetical protein